MKAVVLQYMRYMPNRMPPRMRGWIEKEYFDFTERLWEWQLEVPDDDLGIFICIEPRGDRAVVRGMLRHYRGDTAWVVSHIFIDPEITRNNEVGIGRKIVGGLMDEMEEKVKKSMFSTKKLPIHVSSSQRQSHVLCYLAKGQEEGIFKAINHKFLLYQPKVNVSPFCHVRRIHLAELGPLD